jgi:hypothetical protein
MKEVRIIIAEQDEIYFEVPEELTTAEIEFAINTTGLEHVGGRPKR